MADKSITKWHPKLAKWRTSTEKRTNIKLDDVIVSPKFDMEYINTGSTVLNLLIGGGRLPDGHFVCPGWPRGRIVEVYGRESSGKSTIAMTGMGQCCANGGTGLYVDLECAVIDKYAMALGCDFRPPEMGGSGNAVRIQPRNFEETESLVTNAALQCVDLIVIDSVAALVPRREQRRDTSDDEQKQGVAEVPRLMASWMPKLQQIISHTGTTVIFLNQTRDKIGAKGFSEEALKSTTGGNALKFFASIRLLLKPRKTTKAKRWNPIIKDNEDVEIATDIEVKMIKNKIDATKGHSGLITLRYGIGIDELRTMLNVAEAYKVIKASKNAKKQDVYSFKCSDNHIIEAVGVEKFRLAMTAHQGALAEMNEKCTNHILDGFRMIDDEALAALAEDAVTTKEGDDDDDYDAGSAPEILEQTDPDPDDEGSPLAATSIDLE
jgi:recombination protein RecA